MCQPLGTEAGRCLEGARRHEAHLIGDVFGEPAVHLLTTEIICDQVTSSPLRPYKQTEKTRIYSSMG